MSLNEAILAANPECAAFVTVIIHDTGCVVNVNANIPWLSAQPVSKRLEILRDIAVAVAGLQDAWAAIPDSSGRN